MLQAMKAINRNMGCIEISYREEVSFEEYAINRNMGCIEINYAAACPP